MNRIWKYLVGLVAFPSLLFGASQVERESQFYQLETYRLPEDLKLEVSGLALMPDGKVAVAIRKGEVWLLDHADEPEKTQFSQFASGLHEPLGLAFHDGDLYTVNGYSFQIELTHQVWRRGLSVKEIPIIFTDRFQGNSKMSKDIIREALVVVWQLLFRNGLRRVPLRHID
jgi:hypothetical protein